ncbi:SCP domain-containing protein [Caenorhabditis elegans]|uniref:SCP domain-containing protein n=2 Tax=Caenorhabditis elegans TaxID=6239 RepID=Q20603_CAEEL|nr:SCP domain-containing protein [Caenorhabditis elegans]CAA94344.1 SCP domain-containing protein [Caenorhabditis elegans]|eukprot:NP_502503.1 SCP-Like extracellular protein [Caenorhabditis elegans]
MNYLLLVVALAVGCSADFGSSGQNGIINAHNTLRSKIAKGTYVAKGTQKSPGTNLLKMKWDSAVAASAQNYANGCPTGHSGDAGLGENLYWYWTSGSLGDLNQYGSAASASWEKEFQDYGWKSNLMTIDLFNTGIGHATQMAWAKSNLIGCGVKDCGRDSNGLNKVTVVCQYKPQGNFINQYIYVSGATCSGCPSGTSCETSTGLCV